VRRRWGVALAVALVILAGLSIAGSLWLDHYMSTGLRARAVEVLEERLQSKVQLAGLDVSLGRHVVVRGEGLVVRHHGREDVPPLVSIDTFEAAVPWSGFFERPPRLAAVSVDGLRITTPPKGNGGGRDRESGGCQSRGEVAEPSGGREPSPFLIDKLVSRRASLTLLPSRPDKRPRVFDIAHVTLSGFALDRPAGFEAALTNPVPRGEIATNGAFGPWNPGEPGATPVRGTYIFAEADMSTIKGITGQLESTGQYQGPLRQILVDGEVQVSDFGLTTSHHRLPLRTTFKACVDGTDGDTYLDGVDARLAETAIEARGKVEGQVGVDGRFIVLDVTIAEGRIDDLLRLAVDDDPPLMTGRVDVNTSFELPPGDAEVVERLNLAGRFTLREARFSEGKVQGKINELSRRGRGDMDEERATPVRSAFGGAFSLDDAVLRLSRFQFAVPGAVVQLQGDYGLKSERIDFAGRVRTEARVSQMTTGFKSLLLKAIDPLFARDGAGAIFPITIGGTRSKPSMKVDVAKALLRKN
jgi:hypothetical protein